MEAAGEASTLDANGHESMFELSDGLNGTSRARVEPSDGKNTSGPGASVHVISSNQDGFVQEAGSLPASGRQKRAMKAAHCSRCKPMRRGDKLFAILAAIHLLKTAPVSLTGDFMVRDDKQRISSPSSGHVLAVASYGPGDGVGGDDHGHDDDDDHELSKTLADNLISGGPGSNLAAASGDELVRAPLRGGPAAKQDPLFAAARQPDQANQAEANRSGSWSSSWSSSSPDQRPQQLWASREMAHNHWAAASVRGEFGERAEASELATHLTSSMRLTNQTAGEPARPTRGHLEHQAAGAAASLGNSRGLDQAGTQGNGTNVGQPANSTRQPLTVQRSSDRPTGPGRRKKTRNKKEERRVSSLSAHPPGDSSS